MNTAVLCIESLKKHFPVTKGLIRMKHVGAVKAVDGVSFAVPKGGTFGLVGESGCGKTTIAKCILRVESPTGGSIVFEGKDIAGLSKPELQWYRRSVQAVFQDPFSSLNPRMRVGNILGEPLVVHNAMPRREVGHRVAELLEIVGLTRGAERLYPHEFSGGQRQRIAIARALALNPALVILDEPVSALDVSIRAQVTNLLQDIQAKLGLSYLLIAHDLAVVEHMSDTIGVMYLGKMVEVADSRDLCRKTLHPYTRALFSAALPADPDQAGDGVILTGEVPSPLNPPAGCRFHPRCPQAMPRCTGVEPVLREVSPGHRVACYLYE
ncbi:MAG TPA: oligopeptide/dipeptide ABC transporter ATP-binding protein [Candidatus Methylomirabilis sp.]|nr:oligopeptide/dipeptide ABC transporter ATP-binding protein [Candidatus Methylomirabilis sp.]